MIGNLPHVIGNLPHVIGNLPHVIGNLPHKKLPREAVPAGEKSPYAPKNALRAY